MVRLSTQRSHDLQKKEVIWGTRQIDGEESMEAARGLEVKKRGRSPPNNQTRVRGRFSRSTWFPFPWDSTPAFARGKRALPTVGG